jgi:hypothetical protein
LARFERSEGSQSRKLALSEPVFGRNASFPTVCNTYETRKKALRYIAKVQVLTFAFEGEGRS